MAPNLERNPAHKGAYIAYDKQGFAFRIDKALSGGWRARPSHMAAQSDYRLFFAPTLSAIAGKVGASERVAA